MKYALDKTFFFFNETTPCPSPKRVVSSNLEETQEYLCHAP